MLNARAVIEHTTAYPFRLPAGGTLMCVYCCESYREPEMFRTHMKEEHQKYKSQLAFVHLNGIHTGYLKVDVTDLRCRICYENFKNVDDIARHLNNVHSITIDFNSDLGLIPFRMEKNKLTCPICDYRSIHMLTLSKHVQSHFCQIVCEHCGKAFITRGSLKAHSKFFCPRSGNDSLQRRCRTCKEVIVSRDIHYKKSWRCRPYVCSICEERFQTKSEKQKHLEAEHSRPKRILKCPECEQIFSSDSSLSRHIKVTHTDDNFSCTHCDRKFDSKKIFDRHAVIHTGKKDFVCNVCSRQFNRQSTLTQHMWIHSDVKKHECQYCDKKFNQKVCWKTHMKTRHPKHYDPTS